MDYFVVLCIIAYGLIRNQVIIIIIIRKYELDMGYRIALIDTYILGYLLRNGSIMVRMGCHLPRSDRCVMVVTHPLAARVHRGLLVFQTMEMFV